MARAMSITAEDELVLREQHTQKHEYCDGCGDLWPCPTIRALERIRRLEDALGAQGRGTGMTTPTAAGREHGWTDIACVVCGSDSDERYGGDYIQQCTKCGRVCCGSHYEAHEGECWPAVAAAAEEQEAQGG